MNRYLCLDIDCGVYFIHETTETLVKHETYNVGEGDFKVVQYDIIIGQPAKLF
jgi:hypothetical protein